MLGIETTTTRTYSSSVVRAEMVKKTSTLSWTTPRVSDLYRRFRDAIGGVTCSEHELTPSMSTVRLERIRRGVSNHLPGHMHTLHQGDFTTLPTRPCNFHRDALSPSRSPPYFFLPKSAFLREA